MERCKARDGIHGSLEVDDSTLCALAANVNDGRFVRVHVTVGFCMFIKRACLDQMGLFDAAHFPVGYGEESDFCYRAAKLGWKHVIAGDTFVTHLEGKSFGETKAKLLEEMLQTLIVLHPDLPVKDGTFRERDPVRALRSRLDLARVRRILGGRTELPMLFKKGGVAVEGDWAWNVYLACAECERGQVQLEIVVRNAAEFPNLAKYILPLDTATFNGTMRYLGINTIRWCSECPMPNILSRKKEFPFEVPLEPEFVAHEQSRQPCNSPAKSSRAAEIPFSEPY